MTEQNEFKLSRRNFLIIFYPIWQVEVHHQQLNSITTKTCLPASQSLQNCCVREFYGFSAYLVGEKVNINESVLIFPTPKPQKRYQRPDTRLQLTVISYFTK